jgi:copper chaperone CopZ
MDARTTAGLETGATFLAFHNHAASVLAAPHAQLLRRCIIEDRRGNFMAEFTLRIDGMHCGSCIRRVSQALGSTEGVVVNEVRVGAARFTSTVDPAPVDLAIAALAKAGYTARLES